MLNSKHEISNSKKPNLTFYEASIPFASYNKIFLYILPVICWIRWRTQVFPDPGKLTNPVTGSGVFDNLTSRSLQAEK